MILRFIQDDYRVIEYSTKPYGSCLACAERVVEILSKRNIPYRVIGLLTWSGISNRTPANHYAVVAYIDLHPVIIDPTAGQFSGWQPFYGSMDDWIAGLSRYLPYRLIKGCEFATLYEASSVLGSLFFASPVDFSGVVLQDTLWHKKIINNLDGFSALEERQINGGRFNSLRHLRLSKWSFFR